MKTKNISKTTLSLAAAVASIAFTAASASAATIVASFDVNNGTVSASPTQVGYEAVGNPPSGTQNGITLTTTGSGGFGFRDKTNLPSGGTLTNMLRDFAFVAGASSVMTMDLSGLAINTEYEITTYSLNSGAFQYEYSVYEDSITVPNLIGSKTTTVFPSIGSDGDTGFTFNLTSDGSGNIRFLETSASIVVFNGMTVAAVPEPSAFLLLGLSGGFALLRRRR